MICEINNIVSRQGIQLTLITSVPLESDKKKGFRSFSRYYSTLLYYHNINSKSTNSI